jgi:hypothetical protein
MEAATMKLFHLSVVVVLLAAGCAGPSTTADSAPAAETGAGLTIVGAKPGTFLRVDGQLSGDVGQYAPPRSLSVTSGDHQVEITDASGQVLYHQSVYVGNNIFTVLVR